MLPTNDISGAEMSQAVFIETASDVEEGFNVRPIFPDEIVDDDGESSTGEQKLKNVKETTFAEMAATGVAVGAGKYFACSERVRILYCLWQVFCSITFVILLTSLLLAPRFNGAFYWSSCNHVTNISGNFINIHDVGSKSTRLLGRGLILCGRAICCVSAVQTYRYKCLETDTRSFEESAR